MQKHIFLLYFFISTVHASETEKKVNQLHSKIIEETIESNDTEKVKRLLNNAKQNWPQFRNQFEETPFMMAIKGSKDNCIEVFLQYETSESLRGRDKSGCTSLMYAVSVPNMRLISSILDRASEELLEIADIDGNTPLMKAASKKDLATTELLLKKGATKFLNTPNNNGDTPLSELLKQRKGQEKKIYHLIEMAPLDSFHKPGRQKRTPAMVALDNGDTLTAQFLFTKQTPESLKAQDDEEQTLLMWAVNKGDLSTVQRVLTLDGAENIVHIPDNNGETPIMKSINKNDIQKAMLLLKNRRSECLNTKNKFGYTALMKAIIDRKQIETIRFLLNNGADTTVKSSGGKTALDLAKMMQNKPVIALLEQLNKKS